MLDEDEFSEVASKPVDKSSTTSPARRRPGQDRQKTDEELIETFNKKLAND